MQILKQEAKLHVNLKPGEYYATDRPVIIRTLLGSCVAACMYDPVNRITGMNHFLLSNRRYARQIPVCLSEAGRYGIHAMELLINDMLKLGAKRENLRAKASGGGSIYLNSRVKDNFECVGNVNARFIREFLENEGIPLIAEDLGGENARVVHFLSENYSMYVKKIGKTVEANLTENEHRFWMQAIETQEKTKTQAEIWG
jgi:chemotaxis protein CheD